MSYKSTYSKWQALKYKDPFASDRFVVCHKPSGVCCRPNCDIRSLKYEAREIVFLSTENEAIQQGFMPCHHCLPNTDVPSLALQDENYAIINLNLLLDTIKHVNHNIGFIQPLLETNKEECIKSIMKMGNVRLRNKLLRSTNLDANFDMCPDSPPKLNPSKNDIEHLKLIDIACKHIALAAQSVFFCVQLQCTDDYVLSCTSENSTIQPPEKPLLRRRGSFLLHQQRLKTKKRRGGVLGFKELASKSLLSPWHFHRTFKNMTGVTPKQYGDKCFKYLESNKHLYEKSSCTNRTILINAKIANPSFVSDISKPSSQINDRSQSADESDSPSEILEKPMNSPNELVGEVRELEAEEEPAMASSTKKFATEIPTHLIHSNSTINSSPIIPSPTESDFNIFDIAHNNLNSTSPQHFPSTYMENSEELYTQSGYNGHYNNISIPLTDLPNMSYSYGPIYSSTEQTTDNGLRYNTMDTTMNLMTDSFETASKHLVSEPVNSLEYSRYFTERDYYAQSFDQQILIKQLQLQNSLERNFFDI